MLNEWKQRLFNGWGILRVIRAALAVFVIMEALVNSEMPFALLGGVLLFRALFNYGCCGTSGCDVNHTEERVKSSHDQLENTTFTEIKEDRQ